MLVALLLDVAGVVRDAIVADYLATAAAPGDAADQNTPRGVLGQPLTGRTMIDVLAWLDKRGGAAGYLMAHGVPKSHLRALRRRLTMGEMRPEL